MAQLELHDLRSDKRAGELTALLSRLHEARSRVVVWVADEGRRQILDDRQRFLDAELSRERATLADLERLPPEAEGSQIAILMVDHVIRQMTLELELLDELREHFAIPTNEEPLP